jgi:hypothetical protein
MSVLLKTATSIGLMLILKIVVLCEAKLGDLEVKLHNACPSSSPTPRRPNSLFSGLITCDRGPVSKTPFLKEELQVHSYLHGFCHFRTQ